MIVTSPDASGGIARATATLANQLADTHTVEMIALYRRRRGERYALDPRVTVRCILDEATRAEKKLKDLPTRTPGAERTGAYSALVDAVLPRVLANLEPGVVISTRAIFHLEIARHVPAHCITIGQDHTNLEMREARSRNQLAEENVGDVVTDVDLVAQAITRLDQYVVLTEADAASYREKFPEVHDRLRVIRNPAPWPVLTTQRERQPIIVGVGKLAYRKNFDLLIEAFYTVCKERPDWQLHIYGAGPGRVRLTKLIQELDLEERAFLKGHTSEMERVLEEASILGLTSRFEGLPMVLIEGMTKGTPIVSVDCPTGPSEIVLEGVTGRLVPNEDTEAFAAAMAELMDDPETRARMSEGALAHAGQYSVRSIISTWVNLFEELEAARETAS